MLDLTSRANSVVSKVNGLIKDERYKVSQISIDDILRHYILEIHLPQEVDRIDTSELTAKSLSLIFQNVEDALVDDDEEDESKIPRWVETFLNHCKLKLALLALRKLKSASKIKEFIEQDTEDSEVRKQIIENMIKIKTKLCE